MNECQKYKKTRHAYFTPDDGVAPRMNANYMLHIDMHHGKNKLHVLGHAAA